jgi:hypothetical protein
MSDCRFLECDECGRIHLDDQASDSECCDCGRFKQRMEWASSSKVMGYIESLRKQVAALRADAERYRHIRDKMAKR